MRNKVTILVFILVVLLAVTAVVLTVTKKNQNDELAEVKYAVTSTQEVNSKVVVKVTAAIFNGEDVDPFTYVRLIDTSDNPYYPLNGFLKLSLNKGDSIEQDFEFNYPSSVDCVLEIKDSSGNEFKTDIVFPEVINLPDQNII